jgi:hypothetical protein
VAFAAGNGMGAELPKDLAEATGQIVAETGNLNKMTLSCVFCVNHHGKVAKSAIEFLVVCQEQRSGFARSWSRQTSGNDRAFGIAATLNFRAPDLLPGPWSVVCFARGVSRRIYVDLGGVRLAELMWK